LLLQAPTAACMQQHAWCCNFCNFTAVTTYIRIAAVMSFLNVHNVYRYVGRD